MISDSDDDDDDTTPQAYRRLGVDAFEVLLVHPKDRYVKRHGKYSITDGPNPLLFFDRAERVTIELV